MKLQALILFVCTICFYASCQTTKQRSPTFHQHTFSKADTLRGKLSPERTCYDVRFYDLKVGVYPITKTIIGEVDIVFTATRDFDRLQIDLYKNLRIDSIIYRGSPVVFERLYNAVFVQLPSIKKGATDQFTVYYQGTPIVASNPPWSGGFIWTKDQRGRDWVAVACEGAGASIWWPNKDHLSDEPDSMMIRITVPEELFCVANGNLTDTYPVANNRRRFDWRVSYPINNYNVSINIGDYVQFSETYQAEDQTTMPLDYYVLSYNLEKAKEHFQQVNGILKCFESLLGKYPFWDDGYGLVETPYLGMEHQGAIAYGNKYMRGYKGGMIPADMNWDYIIVHETGHEYFGNSISCNDHAEMWIHESFTTYLEALYVECSASYEDYLRYLQVFRSKDYIKNRKPIVGPMHVNYTAFDSSDHYFKGSWVLHTIRHAIGDDELWFKLFRDFYTQFSMNHVNTETIIDWFDQRTRLNLTPIFQQYLFHPSIPKLVYSLKQKGKNLILTHQWITGVENFEMPLLVGNPSYYQRIKVKNQKGKVNLGRMNMADFRIATDRFLIEVEEVE